MPVRPVWTERRTDWTVVNAGFKSLKVSELREACEARGLDTIGKRLDLIARLQTNVAQDHQIRSDAIKSGQKGEVHVLTRVEIKDEYGIKAEARCKLQTAIAEEELKLASIHATNQALREEINQQTILLAPYNRVRNRFISTFRRDRLNDATDEDYNIIGEANGWVHDGDAKADCRLYSGYRLCCHPKTFEKLYGLLPETVEMIGETYSSMAIIGHANMGRPSPNNCNLESTCGGFGLWPTTCFASVFLSFRSL
ncbi:hypothetical protein HOY82DRAFT_482829 [Tuber indicum]|nr:hypothetical protein HOY82DRAFT_482829 [Tuber indicum]